TKRFLGPPPLAPAPFADSADRYEQDGLVFAVLHDCPGHTVWTIRCFRSTERHTTLSPGANSFTEALLHFVCERDERRPQPAGGPRRRAPAAQVEACLGGR